MRSVLFLWAFRLFGAALSCGLACGQDQAVRSEQDAAPTGGELGDLRAWTAKPPEAVEIQDGVARLAATGRTVSLAKELDAHALAGSSWAFAVEAKGEDIAVGKQFYECAKLKIAYLAEDSEKSANKTQLLSGTFDWTAIKRIVEFPSDLQSAQIILAIENTSGTVWFRNATMRPATLGEKSPPNPLDSREREKAAGAKAAVKARAAEILSQAAFPYELTESLKATPCRIEIQTAAARPLNHALYGFNANLTAARYSYDDPRLAAMVRQLRPGCLRFPGGTVGNWYQWRADRFGGWPESTYGWVKAAMERFAAQNRKYGYDAYARLVKQNAIEPVIMMNILSQQPADAVEWIAKMKRDGLRVRYVELGNENCFSGQQNEETRTVQGYIAVTKRFAQAIRAAHPDVRLAVCGGPCKDKWREKWNAPLSREDYYDAVVHHAYIGGQGGQIEESVDAAIETLLGAEQTIDRVVEQTRALYGSRPVWVTEWNLGLAAHQTWGGTGAAGLYYALSCLRMLDYPDVFEVAAAHQLVGGNFGVFELPEGKDTVKKIDAPVWTLVGMATRGCDTMLETSLTPADVEGWKFAPAKARAFGGKDGLRVLVVNKLPVAKKVELAIDGKAWSGRGVLSTFSVKSLSEKPTFKQNESPIRASSFIGVCRVPPFSVNLIALK